MLEKENRVWPSFARSHRSPPLPNRLHSALLNARQRGVRILDLTGSNPSQSGIELPLEILQDAWMNGLQQPYSPDPQGALRAREAISTYYSELGQRIAPRDILLTASTSEAYSLSLKLFTEPGQEALVPSPSYPLLEDLCRLEGVRSIRYLLERIDENWRLPDPLPGRRVKLLLTVNPNNPTGSILSPSDWTLIREYAQRHRILVICDEVFSDYRYPDWRHCPPQAEGLPLVRLNGISKIAGLPQLKLAWLVVEGPREFRRATIDRLESIEDTYLSLNTPVQWVLPEILAHRSHFQEPIRRRIAGNRDLADRLMRDSSAQFLAPEAGWSALIRLPRLRSDEEWALGLLQERNVLVHPGYLFGFQEEAFIAISLLTPKDDFRSGLQEILGSLEVAG